MFMGPAPPYLQYETLVPAPMGTQPLESSDSPSVSSLPSADQDIVTTGKYCIRMTSLSYFIKLSS